MKFLVALQATTACVAVLVASAAPAQEKPSNPLDPAVKQAQDRLPADQPRVPSSEPATSPDAAPAASKPGEAEMANQILELSKPGENHKLLARMVGS